MKKIIAVALSVVFLAGVFAVATPIQAASLGEIQKQLQSLLGQVKQMQAQNQSAAVFDAVSSDVTTDVTTETSAPTTVAWCFTFKNNLRRGDVGRQVSNLQMTLQKEGYVINERELNNKRFGTTTKAAIISFQEKYNILPAEGFVGVMTRAQLNQLYGCGGTSSSSSSSSIWSSSSSSSSSTTTQSSITVVSPNGGEVWQIGSDQMIWFSSFGTMGKKMRILLVDKDNNENTWSILDYVIADFIGEKEGDRIGLLWRIGNERRISDGAAVVPVSYKIKICVFPKGVQADSSNIACDNSDMPFSIVGTSTTSSSSSVTTASSTVIVKPGVQPAVTLAVGNAIVPFTNFTIDPQGVLTKLADLNIVRTGLGSDGAFREIVLIAQPSVGINSVDEYRIIARAKLGSKSNKLIVGKFPAFNSPINLTIAGVMNDDLSNYAGQVAGLLVDDIVVYQDGQGLFSPTGSRVVGTSHAINNSLKVGNLFEVATPGGAISFNHLELRNSTTEDIIVEKLVLTGKWSGSVKIKETGESFQCQVSTFAVVSCNFYGIRAAGGIVLGKGVTKTLEFDKSADLILGMYGDPLDAVVARGMTYGYQLAPRLGIIGGKPLTTVLSPNGGEVWRIGEERMIQWDSPSFGGEVQLVPVNGEKGWFVGAIDANYYRWKVGEVNCALVPGIFQRVCEITKEGKYYIRVVNQSGKIDSSDAPFSIVNSGTGSGLTQTQIDAIIALLKSFGANQSAIDSVRAVLEGR